MLRAFQVEQLVINLVVEAGKAGATVLALLKFSFVGGRVLSVGPMVLWGWSTCSLPRRPRHPEPALHERRFCLEGGCGSGANPRAGSAGAGGQRRRFGRGAGGHGRPGPPAVAPVAVVVAVRASEPVRPAAETRRSVVPVGVRVRK